MGFWKSFMLAGGQCRSRQRIVRMKESPAWTAISKGRAFGGIKATGSTFSSGFPPSLHRADLSFAVDIRAHGPGCRERRGQGVAPRHAEDRRISIGHGRCRMRQTCRRRKGDAVLGRSCLPVGASRFPFRKRFRRHGLGSAFAAGQGDARNAWGACASLEFRLTAGSIACGRHGLPDAAGAPA